jgi:hypothetical protein
LNSPRSIDGEVNQYAAVWPPVTSNPKTRKRSLFDIDLSWLEWSDIDLSAIFDWFDFS